MSILNGNQLPQTESYHAAQKRSARFSWLPTAAMIASVVVLVMAIAAPLWMPTVIRRFIPDRYIMAYAPEPLQNLIFDIDPNKVLPTPVVPGEAAALPQTPVVIAGNEATPWPTISAIAIPEQTATPSAEVTPSPTGEAAEGAEGSSGVGGGFVEAAPAVADIPGEALLSGVTQVPQGYNKCGPATLTSYMSFYGSAATQNEVSNVVKPHPEDSNTRPDELVEYAQRQGFGAITRINGSLDVIKRLVAAGYPVMVERGFDELPDEGWMGHYMLVVGYSEAEGEFSAIDSYWGTNRRHDDPSYPIDKWEYTRFDSLWQDFNREYIVVYQPAQAEEVASIIGDEMNDQVMLANALNRLSAEKDANPGDPFAWFNLGEVYNAMGSYPEAAASFDMARQLGTPWRTMWYRFGPYEAYLQTGRYEDVMALARAVTDPTNYPESEEAYYYMGRVYAARGETRNAQSMYEKALQYNPNYEAAQTALNGLGG